MYVWTKKAEQEFRARHPHRKNNRKSGTVALWDGKPLEDESIVEGYALKGWIVEVTEHGEKAVTIRQYGESEGSKRGRATNKELQIKHWKQLLRLFDAQNRYSMEDISAMAGWKSPTTLMRFVEKHGKILAEKYGKLPYKEGLKSHIWQGVMEAKA